MYVYVYKNYVVCAEPNLRSGVNLLNKIPKKILSSIT